MPSFFIREYLPQDLISKEEALALIGSSSKREHSLLVASLFGNKAWQQRFSRGDGIGGRPQRSENESQEGGESKEVWGYHPCQGFSVGTSIVPLFGRLFYLFELKNR